MSDIDTSQLKPEQLPMDSPSYGDYLKNLKEISVGGSNFSGAPIVISQDGTITFNNSANGTGRIKFSYGGEATGQIWVDSNLNIVHWSDSKHYFQNIDGTVGFAEIGSDGLVLNGGTSISFTSGSVLTDTGATLELDRTLVVSGDVALDAGQKFQIGATAGVSVSHANIGGLFAITTVGGIVTSFTKF